MVVSSTRRQWETTTTAGVPRSSDGSQSGHVAVVICQIERESLKIHQEWIAPKIYIFKRWVGGDCLGCLCLETPMIVALSCKSMSAIVHQYITINDKKNPLHYNLYTKQDNQIQSCKIHLKKVIMWRHTTYKQTIQGPIKYSFVPKMILTLNVSKSVKNFHSPL